MRLLVPSGERGKGRRRGSPEPEGPIDMNPGAGGPSFGNYGLKGVKGAGVHVPRLQQ
jgi:hypothetical protein